MRITSIQGVITANPKMPLIFRKNLRKALRKNVLL